MKFLIAILWIFSVGGALFAGHEIGFLNGQDYEKKNQGYRFQTAKRAFAGRGN